jgi:hypothetical protein
LHSKQEHGDTGRKQKESDEIKPVVDVLDDFSRVGLDDLAFRDLAEEDQGSDNGAGWKVDVETPAPAVDLKSESVSGKLKAHVVRPTISMAWTWFCGSMPDDGGVGATLTWYTESMRLQSVAR